ncbi:hypothetical protein FIBSPDRAFT_885529 [Athelia psychrophila]|uniref:Uncharacterized protein n=1 Tax=Athelia psychrophila TaxID=1759441 RepID=A0A166RUN8_9AGAM|nr:hypothetical protein FIBSPDRAFT_885529 [Fibularhizoctonia sp. CBS 109695]
MPGFIVTRQITITMDRYGRHVHWAGRVLLKISARTVPPLARPDASRDVAARRSLSNTISFGLDVLLHPHPAKLHGSWQGTRRRRSTMGYRAVVHHAVDVRLALPSGSGTMGLAWGPRCQWSGDLWLNRCCAGRHETRRRQIHAKSARLAVDTGTQGRGVRGVMVELGLSLVLCRMFRAADGAVVGILGGERRRERGPISKAVAVSYSVQGPSVNFGRLSRKSHAYCVIGDAKQDGSRLYVAITDFSIYAIPNIIDIVEHYVELPGALWLGRWWATIRFPPRQARKNYGRVPMQIYKTRFARSQRARRDRQGLAYKARLLAAGPVLSHRPLEQAGAEFERLSRKH